MDDIKRVQLSEIAELITKGTTPTTLGYEFQDNGINFLKIECFDEKGDFIKDKVTHISEECHEKLKRSQLKDGDILFSIAGAIGQVAIVTEEMLPANTNQALAIIRISDEEVYLPYIKLILTSPIVKEQFEKKKQGVAQLNLSLKDINEISIPLPNREKQIELTKLFEKVAGVIAKRNKEIKSLDDLIKARFVELFGDPVDNPMGWTTKQLQELVTDDCTISYGIVQTGDDQDDGVPVFRPVDIVNRVPVRSELKKTTQEISNKYKRTILKGREMLITVRANIADTFVVGEEFAGCNVGRGIVPIRTKENEMILEFLKYQIDSKHLNDNIKALAKGITLIQLNMEDLREVTLIVPPIEKQKSFVEFAKQVDKSKVAVQKALDETQLLFDSLMQKYFG